MIATIESRGVTPLKEALKSVAGWPLIGKSGSFNDETYDWRDALSSQVVKLGLTSIYSISVQPDANDTLVNRVYVSVY